MPEFKLIVNIAASRWFKFGGAELWQQYLDNYKSSDDGGIVILNSDQLSQFITIATQIRYWVDDDEKNNPKMEHTISWLAL